MKKAVSAIIFAAASAAFAETAPVMVSLVTPVQAPSSDVDVGGLRLSLIYGECGSFTGLDIGVVNRSAREFTGVAIGGANIAGERLYGGQIGFVNWNGSAASAWADVSKGCQIGLVNYADSFCGLQDGIVNISDGVFTGLQSGFLNFSMDVNGVECGAYFFIGVNVAGGTLRGCQLGLVNYADTVDRGLQIGIINIISRGGWSPVLPIVNGRF